MVPTLTEITGQQNVIGQVLDLQHLSRKECILLSGPSGSGISWTLDQIAAEWDRNGGVGLKATGVSVTPKRSLLPWLTIASPTRASLARWDIVKGSVAEASKAIPIVGGTASFLVGEVQNYRRKQLAHQAQMLGEREQDLLFVIETITHGKRLLLLVDQLSNWDEDSWALLELIISPALHELYPSLKNVLIIAGVNEDLLPRCRVLVEKLPASEFNLRRIQYEHLKAALKAFAFPLLDEQEQKLLYEATGGRLDLLHDFASFAQDFRTLGNAAEKNVLYGRMIERRLRTIRGDVHALEELLSAASFLGSPFSFEEIGCLTGQSTGNIQTIIDKAKEEKLLAVTGDYLSFPSSAMQRYFLTSRIENPAKYHSKFAECLRRLRSGDYAARFHHLLLAGQPDDALVCHCLAILDARRRRKTIPNPECLHDIPGHEEYKLYLNLMQAGYKEHDNDSLANGLTIVESIEAFLPAPLIAERDYLEAQILMKSHRVADLEKVVVLLRRWQGLKDVEPEIWARIAQTLMVALTETDHYDEARDLEDDLTRYFGARRRLDPWALYGLNCLRRQSECLHHLVPSRNRLESALAYFGPVADGVLPRHPLQYYSTLTNLVANLVAGGLFAEATVRGAQLEQLLQNHTSFDWPSLEVAANNTILAGYLAGVLPLSQATVLMRKLDDGKIELGDRILIQNNLAVLFAHAGQINEAKRILGNAREHLGSKAESDSYHRYFVANNLAGLQAVSGDLDSSLKLFEEAGGDLHHFYPAIRETLLRRHAMMPEAFRVAADIGVEKFDRFLKDHYPLQVGPQWEFYGRGFLLTDIQFWTSD